MWTRPLGNSASFVSLVLIGVAGCSDGAGSAGSSSVSARSAAPAGASPAPATSQSAAAPSRMRVECAALDRVFEEHGKKLAPTANASASADAAGELAIYEEHAAALEKLPVEDAKLKPLFDDYLALIKKAVGQKKKYEAAETKAQALSDFISATMDAGQARLMIGSACAAK